MPQNRETHGSDELSVKFPDAGVVVQAQRAAAENASKVTSAACPLCYIRQSGVA